RRTAQGVGVPAAERCAAVRARAGLRERARAHVVAGPRLSQLRGPPGPALRSHAEERVALRRAVDSRLRAADGEAVRRVLRADADRTADDEPERRLLLPRRLDAAGLQP